LEDLAEIQGVLVFIDEQESCNANQKTGELGRGGLHVEGCDFMLDLLEREALELFCNVRSSLEGTSLKGEHGVVAIESLEARTIGGECCVVKVGELFRDGVDVCHGR